MINFLNGFEMFSLEHFITIGVHIVLILILFFTRKFFIKYKAADITFRVILAGLIMGSEVGLRTMNPPASVASNMPIPLCGHLLWISGIALLANSERIMKKIYPLTLLGATLSMIVVSGIPHFPEFRAWQYFLVHGGFLIGSLYFVFTRKINKFTWKDFGYSCLLLGCMGAISSIFIILGVRDDYMLIHPIAETQFLYDALGQVGYTLVFMIFAALIMAFYTLITWLCTRKRSEEDANIPTFKNYEFMNVISSHYSKKARWISVVSNISFFAILLACQHFYQTKPFAYILLVYVILIFALIIFNEILNNYENYKKTLIEE